MKISSPNRINLLLITLGIILSFHVQADRDSFNLRRSNRDHPFQKNTSKHSKFRRDTRYSHNRNYPLHGHRIDRLPFRRPPIRFRSTNYFFQRGVWYRPSGSRFIVSIPPVGIVIPTLPPFYSTIWARGIPYYYANDIYYTWQPNRNGYMVTEPPEEIREGEPPLIADELFIYPKKGQSEQRQADDRYSCHRWSVNQTHYDPTQSPENIDVRNLNNKRQDYQRAMRACLEGKNYSVR